MSIESENNVKKGLTRRDFVKGSAVAAVGLAAGGLLVGCSDDEPKENAAGGSAEGSEKASTRWSWETAPEPIKDSEIKETIEADIVIVGGGISGVTAALRLSEKGVKVAVIEKNGFVSGRGGGYAAYTSKALQAAGVKPGDKEEIYREWIKRCGSRANEKIVREYLDRSPEAFDWLIDKSEGELTFMDYPTRYVGPYFNEYTGCHLIMGEFEDNTNNVTPIVFWMWKKAEEQGAKFYFKSAAQQLVKDGDKVTAVIVKDEAGYKKFVGKNAVVLASGDSGGDKEMVEAYGGGLAEFEQLRNVYTPVGMNTGDGHKMGMWAGGHMEFGALPSALHLTRYTWYAFGFLHVNIEGNRFMNEDTWAQGKSIAVLKQPGNVDYAWSIFDSKYPEELKAQIPIAGGQFWDDMVRFGEWTPDAVNAAIEEGLKNGNCFKADSLEELADLIGVDKTNFTNTVSRYNEMAKAGEDTDYHKRKEILTTIEKGPFYGMKFGPDLLILPGGLEVNEKSQVLDADKHPIEGLFAIGNVSGGRYGVDYPLVINGNSHGTAITQGYLVYEKVLG